MSQKIEKNYKVNIAGVVNICEDGNITVTVEDRGEFNLAEIMKDFNDRECKINITYNEDYVPEEDEELDIDEETGEVL
jgi:acylphosphatase